MGSGHVLGIRAMEPAAIAAQMRGDTLAAMEDLDGARGDADLDLFADQGVRHRIEEAVDLDVVVRADPSQQIGTVAALKSEKMAAFGWNLHAAHGEAGFAGSGRDSAMITR